MHAPFSTVLLSLLLVISVSACASSRPPVPVGEIPKARTLTASEEAYGHQIFVELSRRYTVDYNDPRLDRITKIVERLTHAAGADQNPWHVYLFRAGEVKNAGATRGNHVFVWSGLLDFVKSDEELATIIGHELAHVLAGHTDPDPNEELKKMLIGIGSLAAGVAVSAATGATIGVDLGQVTSAVTEQIGQGLLVNPYSRELESEADQIGLFLMADAGYNPEAAIDFWTRAKGTADFQSGPSFLSTHPDTADRLSSLNKLLPQAKERYQQAGSPAGSPQARSPSVSRSGNHQSGAQSSNSNSRPGTSRGNTLDQYYADRYGYGAPAGGQRRDTPPTNAPASSNSGDSFDWGNKPADRNPVQGSTPTTRPTSNQNASQNGLVEYQIAAFRGIVYAKPSTRSKPVGEFRQGARVRGRAVNRFWIEIEQPDHGFLRLEDLKPTS